MKQYRNPTPTVDVILERDSNILMVRRKNDPFKDHLSLPGGFVNEGETVEDAMKREALEETSLEVHPIDILGVYSDPTRDPRKHIVTTVFVGIILGLSGSKWPISNDNISHLTMLRYCVITSIGRLLAEHSGLPREEMIKTLPAKRSYSFARRERHPAQDRPTGRTVKLYCQHAHKSDFRAQRGRIRRVRQASCGQSWQNRRIAVGFG
jgi:ADP-ribose pyrophosphatase YjhB (NUDIX family)